jgi:hypothetical protein
LTRTIVITGCDAAHYELVIDLLNSLTDAGREGLAVGFVHVGDDAVPPAIEAAVDYVAPVTDDVFQAQQLSGLRLSYLMVKARLPEFFPGYDTYVWLDGDTWVQNRVGLDQIIHCAQLADLCAHPEIDPNYFREPIPTDRLVKLYGGLYPADAEDHVRLPMFNSGVFAARASSPLWSLWRETMTAARKPMAETPDLYFSDQVPLHRLIATGAVSVHPLMAVNNWLAHAALPSIDLARRRLTTPAYPHQEINILHLTWVTKDNRYRLPNSDRLITFRYRHIKALFAEQPQVG